MRDVVWSEQAGDDYLDILRYIADRNPLAAAQVVDAIQKTGTDLGEFAIGRPGRVLGTYEKSVAGLPYIIAYALTANGQSEVVSILRVIHAARDWPGGEWPDQGSQ